MTKLFQKKRERKKLEYLLGKCFKEICEDNSARFYKTFFSLSQGRSLSKWNPYATLMEGTVFTTIIHFLCTLRKGPIS
jgi:hypothetical protein